MQHLINHRVLDIEPRSIKLGLVSYTTEPGGGPWTRRLSEAATHVGGCAPELLLDLGMHSSKKALLFAAKLLFEARFVGNEDHVRVWVERLGALEATQAAPAPAAPTPANTAPTVPAPPPSSALPADPPCPGCGQPTRVCIDACGAPKYPACAAWRGGYSREEHLVSRLDAVAGFQLRPPPRQVLVLVDDQSEPP